MTKRDEVVEHNAPITQSEAEAEAEAEAAFSKGNNSLGREMTPDKTNQALFPDGRPDYGFDFTK